MIKFRERTNTWPGFVDLFSNLVIILIFLLIVFVFLWTTTSVFNAKSGAKKVAELTRVTTEQSQTIVNMTADDEESERLLVLARTELENSDALRAQLEADLARTSENMDAVLKQKESDLDTLTATYKAQLNTLNASKESLNQMIQTLAAELNVTKQESEQAKQLASEIMRLNAALDAAAAQSQVKDVEYLEMSNRLNKAMADKIAAMNEYQSHFYRAVKTALEGSTAVQIDGDRFVISSDILFQSGAYKLSNAGKKQIKILSNIIRDLENKIPTDVNWIIRVDGHTDNRLVIQGTHGYNDNTQLSLLRALAVTEELTNDGVSRRRLVPSGFGGLHPAALGTDKTSLQKNRRIELRLTNP